jgi:isoleucyl-tRNA synthetase
MLNHIEKLETLLDICLEILNDSFTEIELENIDIKKLPELEQFILHKIYSLDH